MKNIVIAAMVLLAVACTEKSQLRVTVQNSTKIERVNETVEIPIAHIADLGSLIVITESGEQIPYQVTDESLLFQATTLPFDSTSYIITTGEPQRFTAKAFGRLVPERKDDWAWENDRMAFRVYGPALEATGEISNGIDVWLKSTPDMIVNKWYAPGVDYHTDHGQGLDCYKVGRTLGAGAMAPFEGDKLYMSNNFVKAELLDSGAIRTRVRLSYAPYMVNGVEVTELREISLDAGSQFNHITETFNGAFEKLDVAAGIIMRTNGETTLLSQAIGYSEPVSGVNGVTRLALISYEPLISREIENHRAMVATVASGKPYKYLSGAGWSKYGFETHQQWLNAVLNEIEKINHPLQIKVEKIK